MSSPNDDDAPLGLPTDQGRQIIEAYRDLDDAERVIVWSAILTELSRRPVPVSEE